MVEGDNGLAVVFDEQRGSAGEPEAALKTGAASFRTKSRFESAVKPLRCCVTDLRPGVSIVLRLCRKT